jgi:hypothetical protein
MVFTTSTNGTWATIPFYIPGARLIMAPINKPPALPPSHTNVFGEVFKALPQNKRNNHRDHSGKNYNQDKQIIPQIIISE